MNSAAVITVSDSCFRGEREDLSGLAVARELVAAGFSVDHKCIVPDEIQAIQDAVRAFLPSARLVVTTGGTGIGPRDVTPEATRALCDRLLDGVAEWMRAEGRRETPFAALSRALCGTAGASLILNLPGSPRGAVTSLRVALPLLPHALKLLQGDVQHEENIRTQADIPAARGQD